MAGNRLKKVLFIQGGKCFYCKKTLNIEDATLDHIVAQSLGGGNSIDNIGACCKEINQLFANATVKTKIETVLAWNGNVPCPKD